MKQYRNTIDLVPVEFCGEIIHVQRTDRATVQMLSQFYKRPGATLLAMAGIAALAAVIDVLKAKRT